jgi:undecaprenyl-diphosphatase
MGDLDGEVYRWVGEHRTGWLDPFFIALTVAGYAGLLWVALAIALPLLARRRPTVVFAVTALAVWSVDLFVQILKELIHRPRPFEEISDPEPLTTLAVSYSLPSGHAATSFAGAVVLSYFFPRAAPWLLLLATAVAYSRVYIGVHYPGDVVAGAAIGAAWGVAAVLVYSTVRTRRARAARRLGRREARAYSERAP